MRLPTFLRVCQQKFKIAGFLGICASLINTQLWQLLIIARARSENQSAISSEFLVDIASRIGEKDWIPLALELGFTKQEIRDVKKKYPHRSREQVYQVLLLWREKMGQEATVASLELLLSRSGVDIQANHSWITNIFIYFMRGVLKVTQIRM